MLGLSWGFTVIMEKSRRCKAAEYLEERQPGEDPCDAQDRGPPRNRVTLPSPSPGCGGQCEGVLNCQRHTVTLLEDGIIGALSKHHAVQHTA